MAKLLEELRELGQHIEESVFVCSGQLSLTPTAPVAIHYESSGDASVHAIRFPGCSDEALSQLVAASKPASFGRGHEEVLDKSYRDAVQMDSILFTTSLSLAELSILNEIQRILTPNVQNIRARLYKLNVYGPGGFFKAHRDTPRDAQMFGTLVVCLPTNFEGGEFVVQNDAGLVQHFTWGDNPEKKMQWCAFYSDCEHEVLPVTKGYRVTLTYLLENLDEIPVASPALATANMVNSMEAKAGLALLLAAQHVAESKVSDLKPTMATLLAEKLQEALRDPEFAPNGVKLGFALSHGYIIGKNGKAPVLKGSDHLLKGDLDRLGLKYECVPVYGSGSYDYSFMINPESRKRKYEDFEDDYRLQQLKEWEFEDMIVPERDGIWMGDGVSTLYVSSWENYAAGAIEYGPDDCDKLDKLDQEGLELETSREVVWIAPPRYFPFEKVGPAYGNQPSVDHYYASACLIAWVSPHPERLVSQDAKV